jgi:hypothetical protein
LQQLAPQTRRRDKIFHATAAMPAMTPAAAAMIYDAFLGPLLPSAIILLPDRIRSPTSWEFG